MLIIDSSLLPQIPPICSFMTPSSMQHAALSVYSSTSCSLSLVYIASELQSEDIDMHCYV